MQHAGTHQARHSLGHGLELQVVARGVLEKHGPLLARLSREAQVRLHKEGDTRSFEARCQGVEVINGHAHAKVGHRHHVLVHVVEVVCTHQRRQGQGAQSSRPKAATLAGCVGQPACVLRQWCSLVLNIALAPCCDAHLCLCRSCLQSASQVDAHRDSSRSMCCRSGRGQHSQGYRSSRSLQHKRALYRATNTGLPGAASLFTLKHTSIKLPRSVEAADRHGNVKRCKGCRRGCGSPSGDRRHPQRFQGNS